MMSDGAIVLMLWAAFAAHTAVAAGTVMGRLTFAGIVASNAVVGGSIAIYWAGKWCSYLLEGIRWYLADQWLPVYGMAVLVSCATYAAGRRQPAWLHLGLFYLHACVLFAAAVFFSTFELDRLF
jgi:hypothetical protein